MIVKRKNFIVHNTKRVQSSEILQKIILKGCKNQEYVEERKNILKSKGKRKYGIIFYSIFILITIFDCLS